jgi:hypothetical protein
VVYEKDNDKFSSIHPDFGRNACCSDIFIKYEIL